MNILKVSNVLRLPTTSGALVHRCASLFHTSSRRQDIFKVQDEADFNEKVLKSKDPVIVDFFAT